MAGQSGKRVVSTGELIRRYTDQRLTALLGEKARLRLRGEVAVKYEVGPDGQVHRVHIDTHEVIAGPAIVAAAK